MRKVWLDIAHNSNANFRWSKQAARENIIFKSLLSFAHGKLADIVGSSTPNIISENKRCFWGDGAGTTMPEETGKKP